MSEMVYVSLRTDKPGTVSSFTVMMKANSRPAPVLRLVPDRDSRNNSVRPTARLRAVSDFQFSIRDRPCRHPSRLSVSRWNRLFECPAPRIGRRPRLRKTWFGSHSPQYGWFCEQPTYITKPFSINVLRANIRNILANRALLRRAYAGLEDGVGQVPPDCHNTRDWKFMASVRECVMKNIDNPGFCVDMLCGMQNMSRTGFFNKLKALTGHAPADYIRSMRLQYAAQLLREKDCSITEISDDSGFSDVRYFREVFRKYYGMSPSEYRNSMRG